MNKECSISYSGAYANITEPHYSVTGGGFERVLVTGAGTLGTELVLSLLEMDVQLINVLDISEESLWRLEETIKTRGPADGLSPRLMLGDICDQDRMRMLMRDVDVVFHTAALKHVRYTNDNPVECIKTDIDAVAGMVGAAMDSRSVRVLCNMSSDKAALPNNIYGECKRVGERVVTWGNRVSGKDFFSVRCGNFIGSRGSVLDRWNEQRKYGTIKLTSRHMNRFFIRPTQAACFLINLAMFKPGPVAGSVCTPFLKSYNMGLMAEAYAKMFGVRVEEVGAQEGEKMDEVIISDEEARRTEQVESLGWVTRPWPVENPVLGAINTSVVPTQGIDQTEWLLSSVLGRTE